MYVRLHVAARFFFLFVLIAFWDESSLIVFCPPAFVRPLADRIFLCESNSIFFFVAVGF